MDEGTNLFEREFGDADLGDARWNGRVARIGRRWLEAPSASFPKMVGSHAELEGLYRFMQDEGVSHDALLAAHAGATCKRIRSRDERVVIVAHDTTEFEFEGVIHREGMGWLGPSKQGFRGHFALALSADGTRCPHGILGLSVDMPPQPPRRRKSGVKRKKKNGKACASSPNRTALRWGKLVDQTTDQLRGVTIPIHVMDREADGYELLAGMIQKQQRFVVRVRVADRHVRTDADGFTRVSSLRVILEQGDVVAEREVPLSRRRKSHLPDANKKHPPREERVAKLGFSAERVRFQRPKGLDDALARELDVNVVHVREVDPPVGETPVEWMLVTSEPIDAAEQILQIVDYYRARWTIEEFFQSIKTGCRYQTRQLETAHGLLNALAVCIPVAWQLLLLRHRSRQVPDAPADSVLSVRQIEILRAIARTPLAASPSVCDVLYAVAALGGHIKYNGPPGWRTLGAGMEKLLFAEYVAECITYFSLFRYLS